MAPPTIYKTTKEKIQASRTNSLRCYYKKRGMNYDIVSEKKKQKQYIKEFLSSDENYKIVFDLIQKHLGL